MVYMPSLSSTFLPIGKPEKDVEEVFKMQNSEREAILNYLAGNTTLGTLEPESTRTPIPELGDNQYCDTTIARIGCRIILNPWRLIKDTFCGCFVPYARSQPKQNPYVTKHVYSRLTSSDIYLNRNTCILCCIAPPLLTACAYTGYLHSAVSTSRLLCLSSNAGVAANMCSLFTTGWLTYFWHGRLAENEQLSFEEMPLIFDDLTDYLKDRCQESQGDQEEENKLKQLCEKIRKNSQNIVEGMKNSGISPLHVEHITKRFFEIIYKILKNSHFSAIDQIHNSYLRSMEL